MRSSDAVGRPFDALVAGFDAEEAQAPQREEASPPLWRLLRPGGGSTLLTIEAHRLADDAAPERMVLTLTDQSQAEAVRRHERDLNDRLSSVWRLNSMGEMAATLAEATGAEVVQVVGRKVTLYRKNPEKTIIDLR